jgi:non-homologous end joining protein Ku
VDELARMEVDGDRTSGPIDNDTYKESIKTDLPVNVADLTVHETAEVDEFLFPSDQNAYVFYPDTNDPANVGWYQFLLSAARDCGKTLLTTANVRNNEGLYRIVVWRGRIVLQRMLYPEALNDHDVQDVKLPKTLQQKVKTKIEAMVAEFDPEAYVDAVEVRKQELAKAAADGNIETAVVAKKTKVEDFDLAAALDNFEF